MTTLFVKKHPQPDTLCTSLVKLHDGYDPSEWELMTEAELEAWKRSEIESGWIPQLIQPPLPIPNQIDAIKLKRWLVDNDKFVALDTYISTQANFPNAKAWRHVLLRWKEKPVWLRSDPMINQMGQIISMTPAQIDQAFIEAEANYQ